MKVKELLREGHWYQLQKEVTKVAANKSRTMAANLYYCFFFYFTVKQWAAGSKPQKALRELSDDGISIKWSIFINLL